MRLTCDCTLAHVCHMWDTRHPHVSAGPHMCLTCDNFSSHVGKCVKLERHMWDTFEPHVGHMWIQCDFSVGVK